MMRDRALSWKPGPRKSSLSLLRSISTVAMESLDASAITGIGLDDAVVSAATILEAIRSPDLAEVVDHAVALGARDHDDRAGSVARHLAVLVGARLAGTIPGRLYVEVDPDLSFDTDAITARVREIILHFSKHGIAGQRIVVSMAATWEGIRAAEQLQNMGVDCNLTLVCSLTQAIACADAGAFMVSPCVEPLSTWFTRFLGQSPRLEEDPGVAFVRNIHDFYRSRGIRTVVSPASFGTVGQIEALAGCDRLSIARALLRRMAEDSSGLERKLPSGRATPQEGIRLDEPQFRWAMNEDAMASEVLGREIRNLGRDLARLRQVAGQHLLQRGEADGARTPAFLTQQPR